MTSTMKASMMTILRRGMIAAVCLLSIGSCSTSDILDVSIPDVIDPAVVTTPAGARALYAGALGEFIVGIVGDNGGIEGQILVSGSFTDELFNSETFPTRLEYELRTIDLRNTTLQTVFRNLERARYLSEQSAASLQKYDPSLPYRIGESFALAGLTYVFAGENYCSGVPFSNPFPTASYGQPLTTPAIFTTAIERFDSALTWLTTTDSETVTRLNLALVGKGRALLDRGDPGDAALAAAAVAAVPLTFVYNTTHTNNSDRQRNGIFAFTKQNKRFSVADLEGTNGLNFRTATDPRVVVTRSPATNVGFDNATPQWDPTGKYPNITANTPIANGVEAKLIIAEERLLNAPGTTAWLDTLNFLRANAITPAMTPLVDPVTPAARLDLMMRERAFWLYLTGHRLGDMRRLMRQYGRTQDVVFPVGLATQAGAGVKGTYGTDVNLPVPFDELNNPNFTGCIDRNP